MLELTKEEQAWLDAYRKALDKKHPGTVQEMLIYGSKARGQAHAESDLDVLLIVKNEAGALKRELRRIGYLLAATTDVLPSILVYTQDEWESRKRSGSTFKRSELGRPAASEFTGRDGFQRLGTRARATYPPGAWRKFLIHRLISSGSGKEVSLAV